MAGDLKAAGISSAENLRALGPDDAYAKLIANGTRPHFIAYYALVMGLQGRPWNDCQGEEKIELRRRFDALVAAGRPPVTGLARALDDIGVRLSPGDEIQATEIEKPPKTEGSSK